MSNNLIQINNNAFYSCPKLKSIYIPKTLTSIGVNAFAYCSSLENVILENGLESFCPPQASFAGCPKLIEIEFPDSISSFNLDRASGIKKITIPVNVTELKKIY